MVTVQNGMLVLTTEPRNQTIDGSDYYVASGAVNTSHLFAHQYGLFEARVRLPDVDSTQGYTLHSSFWLLEEEGCHQEIDIFEQYASAGTLSLVVGWAGSESCAKVKANWRLKWLTLLIRPFGHYRAYVATGEHFISYAPKPVSI